MNCRKIKKLIPVYLDGEQEDHERSLVEAHLKTCQCCRKEAQAIEKSWKMLGEIKAIKPDPLYMSRFWVGVDGQTSWYEKILQQTRKIFFQRRWIPALASAGVIIVVAGITIHNHFQSHEADTMVADLSEVDLGMVEYIDIIENFDLIREIDFFSDLEIIENIDTFEAS